jgi:hypothetical protein
MAHFVGLDVSVKETSVYVVDDVGNVILEQKVATEPDAIIALLTSLGETYGRIGIAAGPNSASASCWLGCRAIRAGPSISPRPPQTCSAAAPALRRSIVTRSERCERLEQCFKISSSGCRRIDGRQLVRGLGDLGF